LIFSLIDVIAVPLLHYTITSSF